MQISVLQENLAKGLNSVVKAIESPGSHCVRVPRPRYVDAEERWRWREGIE